ncbi:Pyridoxal phosphate-dependent decarboxylase, partial [Metarhizium majus ARSEF 297]
MPTNGHRKEPNGEEGRLNGSSTPEKTLRRAEETDDLINAVKSLIIPYIRAADEAAHTKASGRPQRDSNGCPRNALVEPYSPSELVERLGFSLPQDKGQGKDGLMTTIQDVLRYSVNTWDQGFLDKLTASTNAVGVASELVLAALNTNVHVFRVSPSLTVVEKVTARTLASYFGFEGPHAGGITCQGGSASNLTSLVTARGVLYPDTKLLGCQGHRFAIFTSAQGHFSVEKAAVTCGMGASSVVCVPVDKAGRMMPAALRSLVLDSQTQGRTPLYVNATAGTTVLGAYDPLREIRAVCDEFGMWLHVDGSWGGSVCFSAKQRHKLDGAELADSIAINPQKMLNVPMTCSFLLTGDCGRRGDSLKLALAWVYYGSRGFEQGIDHAFDMARRLATLVDGSPSFELVSTNPPPCLQVCFYHAPGGRASDDAEENTMRTREMVQKLVVRGFMVDFAPGPKGYLFRVVVNCQTLEGTVDGLFKALCDVGQDVCGVDENNLWCRREQGLCM